MLIGFSCNTSKILPKVLCKSPRHCAPIIRIKNNQYIMLQFVRHGYIAQIHLTLHGIKILRKHGWIFIKKRNNPSYDLMLRAAKSYSCVQLCKIALNIRAPFVQTPRGLYKILKRQ